MAIVSLTTRAVSRAIGADEKKKLAKALQGLDRRVYDLTMAALDRPSDDDEVEVVVTLTKGRQTAVVTTGLVVQRRFFDSKTGKIKKSITLPRRSDGSTPCSVRFMLPCSIWPRRANSTA